MDTLIQSLIHLGQNMDSAKRKELSAIINAKERVSPRFITELDADEIFVFGSNIEGEHNGRASELAHEKFGAQMGVGAGRTGNAYAIPTTYNYCVNSYTPAQIKPYITEFINYARNNKHLRFFVTRVGCGFANITDDDIAPLFEEALKLDNIFLPQSFLDVLFGVKCNCATPSELVPYLGSGVKNFSNEMEQRLSQYLNWLRNHKEIMPEGDTERLDIMDAVERVCGGITKAIELSFRGVPSSAYTEIKKIMDTSVKYFCCKRCIPFLSDAPTDIFYRMRVESDNWAKKEIDKYGMFHIPFSMRDLVKTQRYSVPGYPCLYLAEHVFGCWEELGRPNLNDCLISAVERQKNFQVLDLRIPAMDRWEKDDKDIIKTIILFPLVIACTFKSSNPKATYKPEYIIPQLLLQYVKELAFDTNRQISNRESRVVYGIRYTSVNITNAKDSQSDLFDFNSKVYDNYVIPVIDIKNEHCSKLKSLFTITDPICEEFERLDNVHNNFHQNGEINKEERYNNSIFGKLEAILKTRNFHTL